MEKVKLRIGTDFQPVRLGSGALRRRGSHDGAMSRLFFEVQPSRRGGRSRGLGKAAADLGSRGAISRLAPNGRLPASRVRRLQLGIHRREEYEKIGDDDRSGEEIEGRHEAVAVADELGDDRPDGRPPSDAFSGWRRPIPKNRDAARKRGCRSADSGQDPSGRRIRRRQSRLPWCSAPARRFGAAIPWGRRHRG